MKSDRKEVTNNEKSRLCLQLGTSCFGKISSQPFCLVIVISSEKSMLLEMDDSSDLAGMIAL